MIGLFLDDERDPGDVYWIPYPDHVEWTALMDPYDFMETLKPLLLKNHEVLISLDHDLGFFDTSQGQEITGYEVLKWIVGFCQDNDLNVPDMLFHSQNPVGVDLMKSYLENAQKILND